MHSSQRNELRQAFFTAWQKHLNKQPIEPFEAQIIEVILQHPEYHEYLNNPEKYRDKDFPEINPFLHLSLHLALREQISTNRPHGINQIYQTLCHQFADTLLVEHKMMTCLEEILWDGQQSGIMPAEQVYLQKLSQIIALNSNNSVIKD